MSHRERVSGKTLPIFLGIAGIAVLAGVFSLGFEHPINGQIYSGIWHPYTTDAVVTEKGRITYADISPLQNSGGFWYPITTERAEELMGRFAAATDRELRLPSIPHPHLSNYAYYSVHAVPYPGCYATYNETCLSRPHFLVSYDESSRVTDIVYRLNMRMSPDERSDFLKTFAEKIGFDIKREELSAGYDTVYAADGGTLNAFDSWPAIGGGLRGPTAAIGIGGWSNDISDWPRLMSDQELFDIARDAFCTSGFSSR